MSRVSTLCLFLGAALLASGCGPGRATGAVPGNRVPAAVTSVAVDTTGWRRVQGPGPFSLALPPTLERDADVIGIDPGSVRFRGLSLAVGVSYNQYARPAANAGEAEFLTESLRVDQRPAEFWFYRNPTGSEFAYHSGVYIPVAVPRSAPGRPTPERIGLVVSADCKTRADCAVARRIFESVRFERG